MSIFLSVIVPVYNAEKYFASCLGPFAEKLCSDWELILVDDGSTDGSFAHCARLAEGHSGIRFFSQTNGGPNKARRRGLAEASGKYVTFLDADDTFAEGTLDSVCHYLRHHETDVAMLPVERRYADGTAEFDIEYADASNMSGDELRSAWCCNDPRFKGYLCGKIYRRELLDGVDFPEDMRFAEDMYALSEIFMKVQSVHFHSQGAYVYYKRENTPTSGAWTWEKAKQLMRAYLHRWQCAESGHWSERDQIRAWNSALVLFCAERKRFPHADWASEFHELQKQSFRSMQIIKALSGFRAKVGFLRNWLVFSANM